MLSLKLLPSVLSSRFRKQTYVRSFSFKRTDFGTVTSTTNLDTAILSMFSDRLTEEGEAGIETLFNVYRGSSAEDPRCDGRQKNGGRIANITISEFVAAPARMKLQNPPDEWHAAPCIQISSSARENHPSAVLSRTGLHEDPWKPVATGSFEASYVAGQRFKLNRTVM